MTLLLYLAKPTVGGWVTFTAHLSLLKDFPIYRIGKRTELKQGVPKLRNYGYGCQYQNITVDDLLAKKMDIIVTAVDKTGYDVLEKLPDGTKLVIHDPTELKASQNYLQKLLPRFSCLTIRETVYHYLKDRDIESTFLYHPYVSLTQYQRPDQKLDQKSRTVSISRIDYDKHTEIILKANQLLLEPVEIYGTKNDRFVYHKLKDLDPMKPNVPGSNYRGSFPKDFTQLADILNTSKFVIDMSRIKDDGGGSQYTFLEAIDFNCALILHGDWVKAKNSCFIPGVNCLTVDNEDQLVDLLNSEPDVTEIVKNAKKLLQPHLQAAGW